MSTYSWAFSTLLLPPFSRCVYSLMSSYSINSSTLLSFSFKSWQNTAFKSSSNLRSMFMRRCSMKNRQYSPQCFESSGWTGVEFPKAELAIRGMLSFIKLSLTPRLSNTSKRLSDSKNSTNQCFPVPLDTLKEKQKISLQYWSVKSSLTLYLSPRKIQASFYQDIDPKGIFLRSKEWWFHASLRS